jgi:YbbR domain-containing protein
MGGADVGAREYKIQATSGDGRVRISSIEPPQTEVRVSLQKRKSVPVRVNITDSVPFGYEARPPVVTPSQVEIVGPQSLVESVATAVVDLPLSGARATINQTFNPQPHDGSGRPVRGVEINPNAVVVELPIEQQVAYKLVSLVPDVVGNVALGYQIVGVVPDPATVTVVGDPQTLDRLTQITTQPIDVTNLSSDLHKTTELVLPSGVSLARKQAVVVRVYVNAIQGSQTIRITPTLRNVEEDSEVTFVPNAVDVTLSGPMPSLLSLKPQDVRVTLDVAGKAPGTHALGQPQLQVAYPSGLMLEKVNPEQVMVTIK